MTPLLARQCLRLRAPPAAAAALQRLRWCPARAYSSQHNDTLGQARRTTHKTRLRPAAALSNSRIFEHSTFVTPPVQESDIVPVNSATLVPASIAAATPEHFIEKFTPAPPSLHPLAQSVAVFLLTPSFAPWLLNDHVFLEKAVHKLYKDLPQKYPVRVVCAVVDRLPEAQPVGGDSGRQPLDGEFAFRARRPPVTETGHEGIAYVLLPQAAYSKTAPKTASEIGCLDFLAHTQTDANGRHYDRIRVPLANTVFQTGEPSTLISSVWKWSENHNKFEIESRKAMKSYAVNLSAAAGPPRSSYSEPVQKTPLPQEAPVLGIPLLPLTLPRQVDGHMGNIIRGVIGPDGAKITASTELEEAVPQYFKSRNEPAQATSAWALVIPKEKARLSTRDTMSLLFNRLDADPERLNPQEFKASIQNGFESLWQPNPPRWNVMIQDALSRGARLHKVLSGGGGWGKKAGLLSLDPMPIGPPKRTSEQEDIADDYDSVDDFSTALKPVIQDGDFIQFFISAAPAPASDNTATFKRLQKLEESVAGDAWSWEFGVVPSTVDSIPGGSWQHTGDACEEMVVFRGSFGALTEGGLTVMRGLNIDRRYFWAETDLNTTMVDVPFSRWSAVRLHPKGKPTVRVSDLRKKEEKGSHSYRLVNANAGNPR